MGLEVDITIWFINILNMELKMYKHKIKKFFLFFLALLYSVSIYAGNTQENNLQLVKTFLQAVLENENFKPDVVKNYISEDYIQLVDNNPPMNSQAFIEHMVAQKKIIPKVNVTFLEIIAEGDKVAEIHLVKAKKKNNEIVEGKVIAFWTIKNGKITKCEELVKITKGNKEDEKLGHVTTQ